MAWNCPQCGACWSDLFMGPCPHPILHTMATNANPPWPTCDHDFYPSDTSVGGLVCRKCGSWQPSSPTTYISMLAVGETA